MTTSEACDRLLAQILATSAARADAEGWRQVALGCLRFMREQSTRIVQLERTNQRLRDELTPIWDARRRERAA